MQGAVIEIDVSDDQDGSHVIRAFQVDGLGLFEFDIVGESRHQAELLEECGGLLDSGDGIEHETNAILIPVDDNPHDPSAVEVHIGGTKVGFLPRDDAQAYRAFMDELSQSEGRGIILTNCDAMIVGGYAMRDGSRASLGVKLDLDLYSTDAELLLDEDD